jgi:predicted Zn-ribbon and HTH transcriptional regulator
MSQIQVTNQAFTELAEAITRVARPKTIKAPRFSKERDLSEYLLDFERIQELNQWGDEEAGIELQNALEGEALTCALSVQTTSFQEIVATLRDRLVIRPEEARLKAMQLTTATDDVDKLAADCRRLVDRGFGAQGLDVRDEFLEQEKLQTFYRGLKRTDLAIYVKGQHPASLQHAVRFAKDFLLLDKARNPPKVRAVDTETESSKIDDLVRQIEELKAKTHELTQEPVKCFNCGENHFARGCPHKNKKTKNSLN